MVGYSPWSADAVLEATLAGETAPGDWIVATDDLIASAPVGARPYFFTDAGVHGPDFFDVVHRAGLEWRWDVRAVRSLAAFGHTIGTDTLHPDVRRMPSASIVRFSGGRAMTAPTRWWDNVFRGPGGDPFEALRLSVGELDTDVMVSLSGGYDSRLLLAVALNCGLEPKTATMGYEDTDDRLIAERLANAVGLEHRNIELTADGYLDAGPEITRLTGGTKGARHWHTYLYTKALAHAGTHLVGSNGEFARSHYFDHGRASLLAQRVPRLAAEALVFTRVERQGRRFSTLLGGTRDFLEVGRYAAVLMRGPRNAMDALDYFYATQRVRHFIGNGFALYASASRPMSPFLDHRWMSAVAALRREQKLGEAFHREAIGRFAPQLMTVPIGGHSGSSYSPWRAVATSEATRALLLESPHLDQFADRSQREVAWYKRDLDVMDWLVTLHFAGEAAAAATQSPTR